MHYRRACLISGCALVKLHCRFSWFRLFARWTQKFDKFHMIFILKISILVLVSFYMNLIFHGFSQVPNIPASLHCYHLQYDWSNGDLDWRIDFRYLDFICIIKYLRSRLIKGCSIEWLHLHLLNLNLWLGLYQDFIFQGSNQFYLIGRKISYNFEKRISSIGLFL